MMRVLFLLALVACSSSTPAPISSVPKTPATSVTPDAPAPTPPAQRMPPREDPGAKQVADLTATIAGFSTRLDAIALRVDKMDPAMAQNDADRQAMTEAFRHLTVELATMQGGLAEIKQPQLICGKGCVEQERDVFEQLEIRDRLESIRAQLAEAIAKKVDIIVAAQSDADRASAKASLERLRAEKAAMDRAMAAAKKAAAKKTPPPKK